MSESWKCTNCRYEHPEPTSDPFYQEKVKTLMYCCAVILLLVCGGITKANGSPTSLDCGSLFVHMLLRSGRTLSRL